MQMNDLDAKYGVSQQAASAMQVNITLCRLMEHVSHMQQICNSCQSDAHQP